MRCRFAFPLLLITFAAATAARAQDPATPAAGASACYGFAFGKWTPALDLKAAGHATPRGATPAAPSGRGWADDELEQDSTRTILFPDWWPAGVVITWARRAPDVGDTVQAAAVALVANGASAQPRAAVRAWGVDCGRPAPRAPLPPPGYLSAQPVPTSSQRLPWTRSSSPS